MRKNDEYKQIFLQGRDDYDALKGKVVDRIAFVNRDSYDTQFCVVIFTDKSFIAVGMCKEYLEDGGETFKLCNFYLSDPNCVDNGCFDCHCWFDRNGDIHFRPWLQTLKDLELWIVTEEEQKKAIERKNREEEEREWRNYLRLKKKFENREKENKQ